jgi:DNA primase
MFTHKSDIEQLKQYPISDYLSSNGIQPFNTVGNQIAYHSPLTNERTASFLVEPTKNVFNDYSSGQKGDIITLIKILERMTFSEAINRLQALKSGESAFPFSFSGKVNLCSKNQQIFPFRK